MSFSKAKLKRFNDIDVTCGSPSVTPSSSTSSLTSGGGGGASTVTIGTAAAPTSTSSSSTTAHPERKEQIEKFFKEAVRFGSSSKEAKEFAIPKEGSIKEDKKSKGLRLFRTPSLPQRLRFRQNSDITATASTNSTNNNTGSNTASSTPLHSVNTTPVKQSLPKSASRLKGKEALQNELRHKNELLESYMSQMDVLKRHVEQLKETELKLREENANMSMKTDTLIHELTTENMAHKVLNEQLSADNIKLTEHCDELQAELKAMREEHLSQIEALNSLSSALKQSNEQLEAEAQAQSLRHNQLQDQFTKLEQEIFEAREKLANDEEKAQQNFELVQNLKNTNDALITDVTQLKRQIEQDALAYAQENKTVHNEMECLKNERNTLKHDLASKCDLIRALQEELLDKNCEIDAHCDTIRQLCREKSKYVEREHLMEATEEKVRAVEAQAEQKVQKLETELETAIGREKAYWRSELEKRQKLAENEIIKIDLEKQDVMVLLESTNDMLRERDEKIQKYEDQLRNGIDYYVQLTDNLQKQVVDLKQDMAKTITEKYNYQLTLGNTRSTVNILMERLKKSDADVEQFKSELESVQLAKFALEQSYLTLQSDVETLKSQLNDAEAALLTLRESSKTLQNEVSLKETIFNQMLTSEEETLAKFNKIASSFQERIDIDAARYLELYNELKSKDENREIYMQDMKKALDEFATVLQFAQIELDSKDKSLVKVREESEQLKLENISLKSKLDEQITKKENSTDLEKIEDLLIDSELRAECDKITSWLLCSTDKSVRNESSNEMSELLKPATPNSKTRQSTTPIRSSAGKAATAATAAVTANGSNQQHQPAVATTPRTPRTPKTSSHTPRTTPKKTVLFAAGKENVPSPQKQVLKARNM